MITSDSLDSADSALSRADHFRDLERARLNIAELDRLAEAVENLRD